MDELERAARRHEPTRPDVIIMIAIGAALVLVLLVLIVPRLLGTVEDETGTVPAPPPGRAQPATPEPG